MRYYHVIGWSKRLAPESVGKSTTVSDGAMFRRMEHAREYAAQTMRRYWIEEHTADELPPAVDYYLREGIWHPTAQPTPA